MTKARPANTRCSYYYLCNSCDEIHDDDTIEMHTVYWHAESERVDGNFSWPYVFNESCGTDDAWFCTCCDTYVEEPDSVDKPWECGECGQLHPSKEVGDECCE